MTTTIRQTAYSEAERPVTSWMNPKRSSVCLCRSKSKRGKMPAPQNERQSVRKDGLNRVRSLEREIKSVDEEIDRRAYQLYGLTDEEIKIIEGN